VRTQLTNIACNTYLCNYTKKIGKTKVAYIDSREEPSTEAQSGRGPLIEPHHGAQH